jgi:hypothetical protein
MKKSLLKISTTLLLSVLALNFSGCAGKEDVDQTILGKKISIEKIQDQKDTYRINVWGQSNLYAVLSLKEAAYFGKKKGFKYFSINKKDSKDRREHADIDNLIPMTTINDYLVYKGWSGLGEKGPNNEYRNVFNLDFVRVTYTNERINDGFYFAIDKVIDEEIVLRNPYNKEGYDKWLESTEKTFAGTNIKYRIVQD